MPRFNFDPTGVEPWTGDPTKQQIMAMTDRERLDAAISYAEHSWHSTIDIAEYAYSDLQLAVELAATDCEYWDAVRLWAQDNSNDLSPEYKALLFDALVLDRPDGRRQPVKQRNHMRLRQIARTLRDDYGFQPTRNDVAKTDCAASILERLGIEGADGKPMAESSFKHILKGL